jgi:hypothetical protein
MRKVTISKHEFDNFLFPAWANAQNPGDPELVVRVTRKLKGVSLELPLRDWQQQQRSEGKPVYADRTARENENVLVLEDDEWRCLRDVFKRSLTNFLPLAMEEAYDLSQKFDSAYPAPEIN